MNPVFGLIELIVLEDDDCNFVVNTYESCYIKHYASYKLGNICGRDLVNIKNLEYYQSFHVSNTFVDNDTNDYIILPAKYY